MCLQLGDTGGEESDFDLEFLNDQNSNQRPPQLFAIVSEIARSSEQLDKWLAALPTSFCFDDPSSECMSKRTSDISTNLARVLRLRYHHILILIHRPMLMLALSALDPNTNPDRAEAKRVGILNTYCQPSLQVAVESSTAIISIANSFEFDKTRPGMWWVTLNCGKVPGTH